MQSLPSYTGHTESTVSHLIMADATKPDSPGQDAGAKKADSPGKSAASSPGADKLLPPETFAAAPEVSVYQLRELL